MWIGRREFRRVLEESDARWRETRRESDERWGEARRESEEKWQAQLQFTREVVRRNELAFQEFLRALHDLRSELRELGERTEAHTKALFALIDRLQNGGAAPATG